MTEELVPTVKTPVTMEAYARALCRAWRLALGAWPEKRQAGVLWAQYGIETGAGPWCWNYNIGNVKHVPGDGHDYIQLANTWEIIGGKKVYFQPPHPATWFRAFGSLDEAMVEHFAFLRGRRYGVAWEGVELGDCGLFARRLKAAGYYTADANAYAQGMRAHFDRWMRSTAFDDALAQLVAESERATEPELPDPPSTPTTFADFQIVHPPVPLGRDDD